MLKKFIEGLVFGSGFSISFVTIWIMAFYFVLPQILENQYKIDTSTTSFTTKEIDHAPPLNTFEKFLGVQGRYSGYFDTTESTTLAAGKGVIRGKVTANNTPVTGLKLKLALNGSTSSQWGTTDENGIYHISVPYGNYRVDGYTLDYNSANKSLPGKIAHPSQTIKTDLFEVSAAQPGKGLDFQFIDPIVKAMKKRTYSVSEVVILEWKPYPQAQNYEIQVYEKPNTKEWDRTPLFDWLAEPQTRDTHLDLSKLNIDLKQGHYYIYSVRAFDSSGHLLSESHHSYDSYDFEVVE